MDKKLKTNIKFTFEEIEEVSPINMFVDMNPNVKTLKKKIRITDISKPKKLSKDASTRLF